MVQTIYDKTGKAKAKIAPSESSTQVKEVQGDNILTLSFTHYANIALDVNDYTDFEGERYWLMEKYAPKQNSESEWVYDLKLYGIESIIKRFLVLETTNGNAEPVFTLTAPPRDHVKMIVKCINDGLDHTTDWKVGQVDGTDNIVIDYEGKYCDEALKEIAEKVGGKAEWWIEGQTVNICRCEHGEELAIGYGNGLTELERDTSNTAKFYTRLFPIGSTRNIDPEKYGHSRLMLPGGLQYVELHTDEYGIYDHYEQDAFSGIYPRRTGEVSSVRTETKTNDDGNPFNIYYFKDETLNFDPNEYELTNEVKRVSFQDGELAGLGTGDDHYFEVNFNSKTREFEIITIWPYDDDTQLPGGNLIPKVGDHYILWNIRMPDEYYALAEEEFRTAVDQYNAEHWQDISIYKGATDHVWVEQNKADLFVGRRVRLESEKFFPDTGYRSSRITKITRKVTLPSQMDLEISDARQTGALEKVNDSIGALKDYTRERTSGNLPDIIHSWEDTLPTDTNLFSARRSQRESLSKKSDDTAQGVITFAKGLISEMLAQLKGGATFGTGGNKFDEKGNVVANTMRSADYDNAAEQGFSVEKDAGGRYRAFLTNLTVWGKAMFHELEIRKLSYAGGNIYLSGAGSKIVKAVPVKRGTAKVSSAEGKDASSAEGGGEQDGKTATGSGESTGTSGSVTWEACDVTDADCAGWKCYLLADDGTTATMNHWQEGDQARCRTMGEITAAGSYEDASNRSWWRTIPDGGVSTRNEKIYGTKTETYTDADGKTQTRETQVELYDGQGFAWIVVGKHSTAFDGVTEGNTATADLQDAPMAGDTIVLDGNRHRNAKQEYDKQERQNVIVLETTGDYAPRIACFANITEYKHTVTRDGKEVSLSVFETSPKGGTKINSSMFEFVADDGSMANILNYRGDWSASSTYHKNDQVNHDNAVWVCVANSGVDVKEEEPSDTSSYWKKVLTGGKGEKGDKGDGVVMAYKHADTQPDAPTATVPDALTDGWSLSPDAGAAGEKVTNVTYGSVYQSGQMGGSLDSTPKTWTQVADDGVTWMKSPAISDSCFALMQVAFTTQQDNVTVSVVMKAYSEQNYDYLEVWPLDAAVPTGSSFRGQGEAYVSGNGVEAIHTYTVPKAGRHTICVTYAKDNSQSVNGDYGLFRVDLSNNSAAVAVSQTVWMSQGKVSGGKCVLPWSTPVKVNGADGIGAMEIIVAPDILVFDTDDDGIVPNTSKTATIACYRDDKMVTNVEYDLTEGGHPDCAASISTSNNTATVTISSIAKDETYDVSKTSGTVEVQVYDKDNDRYYFPTVKYAVNVAKFNGGLKADNKELVSEYTKLKGDVDNKFTAYDSKLEQTAERISSAVSKVDEVGKTVSEIKQTSNGISSTVTQIRSGQIGNNFFTGVSGIGWHGGVFDGAGGFCIPYTDYAFLPPIANFTGDYILSFGNFNENLQIEIYQTNDAYEINKLNYYCNFNGDKELPILLVVEGDNNDTLNNTYLVTSPNADLASLKKDDIVVVQKHITSSNKDVYPKCKIKTIISDTTDSFQASKVEHRYLYKVTVSEIAGTDDNAKTYNSYGTVSLVCSVSTNDTVVDGTALNTVNLDNNISSRWIRFKGDGNTWLIRVKALGTNTDIYFGMIMVEDVTLMGDDIRPHRFSFESSALSSSIKQTATEIRQQVGDSYTSLKNGNFTIGANTKIQGNLNVTGTENKITVVNDDSTQITQIQPVSVGTWSGLKAQSTISLPLYKTNNYTFMTDQYGHISTAQLMDTTGNLPVTEYFDVGDFVKNDSIQFALRYCHRLNENGNEVSQFSCKFDIYSISGTGTMTLLKTANSGDYFTLTLTDDGTIRVKVSVTIKLPTLETFTPNSFATLTYKLGLNTVIGNKGKLITTVGYDGISGSLGNGNYFMLGKDVAAFKYGKYELKITKDGIIGLNAKKVKRIQAYDSECTLIGSYWTFNCDNNSDYNTFIGIGTRPIKLLLPSNPIEGQEITVVDKAFGQDFMVQAQGGYKTCFDGSTSSSTYTGQHELPTNTTWHFIFSYDTWYAE